MIRAIPLKITSLAIALLLTYAVQSAQNASVVSLFVPIELKNAPVDKAIVKPTKRGVQVTLKGPSFLIGPVASSPPAMKVKLPDTNEDSVTVSFKASDMALPSPIEVLSIEPSQMEFVFEQLGSQDLRVEVQRIGKLPQGLVLQGIEISPKVVGVRGAQSDLGKLKSIEAEPIDLSKVDESTELTLGLRVVGASVTPATRTVVAKVLVGQQPTEKIFTARPVELRMSSGLEALTVKPEKVTVTLSGAPNTIGRLDGEKVIPFVRVSDQVSASGESMKVEVDVPDGMSVVSVEPASVLLQPRHAPVVKGQAKRK